MDDASDEVYDHILCAICPVKLSKPGLSYQAELNEFHERIRDWIVEMPDAGFLFPAFNDRSTDIHNILYYTKNPEDLRNSLVDQLLGCVLPLTAKNQKETFQTIIEDTLSGEADYDIVRSIHENLTEMIEEKKEEPEPLVLDKTDIKNLLSASGIHPEKLENLEKKLEETGPAPFMASNIANTRKFEVKHRTSSFRSIPPGLTLLKPGSSTAVGVSLLKSMMPWKSTVFPSASAIPVTMLSKIHTKTAQTRRQKQAASRDGAACFCLFYAWPRIFCLNCSRTSLERKALSAEFSKI